MCTVHCTAHCCTEESSVLFIMYEKWQCIHIKYIATNTISYFFPSMDPRQTKRKLWAKFVSFLYEDAPKFNINISVTYYVRNDIIRFSFQKLQPGLWIQGRWGKMTFEVENTGDELTLKRQLPDSKM